MITLNDNDLIPLLKEKKIYVTKRRLQVLKMIYNQCQPVFRLNVFLKFDSQLNRISVHRILRMFVKKEILNTVPNTKGVVEYTLPSAAGAQSENIRVSKFICKKCGSVTYEVLPNINIVPAFLLATTILTF